MDIGVGQALVAASLVGGSPPLAVQAVAGAVLISADDVAGDENTTVSADIQIDIEGGALTLVALPKLTFTSLPLRALIAGSGRIVLADSVAAERIEVQDTRGTNGGWQLSAQLGSFHQRTDERQRLAPVAARFDRVQAEGRNAAGVVLRPVDYSQQPVTLVNAPAGSGSGLVSIPVTGAEVTLAKTVNAKAGDYVATMTWQLSAQPEPPALK